MLEWRISRWKICVHFSFFAAVGILCFQNRIALLGLYACILHECGHLFVMNIFQVPVKRLVFYGAGIKIETERVFLPCWKEAVVLASGCASNLICCAACWSVGRGADSMMMFGAFHLCVALFNLLPLHSLDGGKLLALTAEHLLPMHHQRKALLVIKALGTAAIAALTLLLIRWNAWNWSFSVSLGYLFLSEFML